MIEQLIISNQSRLARRKQRNYYKIPNIKKRKLLLEIPNKIPNFKFAKLLLEIPNIQKIEIYYLKSI